MDNVHTLRNAHGADLVSLIIEGTSLCGIAWLMTTQSNAFEAFAFSVVARICATGNYSFGHELGHNMGLQHDRADAPADGVFPFSHGYVDAPHGFRDIMGVAASCGGCMRIQNFSNPNVTFNGFPTGVPQSSPQSADAAASLNGRRSLSLTGGHRSTLLWQLLTLTETARVTLESIVMGHGLSYGPRMLE